jgi:hypothetical protein
LNKQHTLQQINLIALWAFCESGLGGLLHAIRLPFTGFVVGGFACIILMLLAFVVKHKPYQIIEATLVVMAIKFAVSPHAPLPAYIAVGFQGLLAYLLLGLVGRNWLSCVLFASLAMLESALQKFLLATLLYGKSLWQAIDAMALGIGKEFNLPEDFSASFWIISIYSGIYFLWGIFLGSKGYFLPQYLEKIYNRLPKIMEADSEWVQPEKKKKKLPKYVGLALMLAFITFSFWLSEGSFGKGTYVLLRTISILLALYFLVIPILTFLLHKLLTKAKEGNLFKAVSLQMQATAIQSKAAWKYAGQHKKGLLKIWFYMEVMLALNLYGEAS